MGADERGKVHRIGPGRKRAKGRAEESATRYSRSQDHLDHFSQLVRWELEDEMAQVEQRLKEWPKRKLASHGLALFDLHARTDGWMFGDRILRLTAPCSLYTSSSPRDATLFRMPSSARKKKV